MFGIITTAISLKSLSVFNCVKVGSVYFLVSDLSIPCSGIAYDAAFYFNIVFAVTVVLGWPLFLIFYLRQAKERVSFLEKYRRATRSASLAANSVGTNVQVDVDPVALVISDSEQELIEKAERFEARVGFIYEPYRTSFIYWDVVEALRQLYLVAIVAFFTQGSMVQIALSIFVSVAALCVHIKCQPYRRRAINLLQGACLTITWLTFQCGQLLVPNKPDTSAGDAALYACFSYFDFYWCASEA